MLMSSMYIPTTALLPLASIIRGSSTDNVAGQLKILKEMYDSGDLTQEEYTKAKKKVLE